MKFKKSVQNRINTCELNFDNLSEAKEYYSTIIKLNPLDGKNDGAVYIAKACLNRITILIDNL